MVLHLDGCFDAESIKEKDPVKNHVCGCQKDHCNAGSSLTSSVALIFGAFALLGAKLIR